jgi:hypothetical protein
MQMIEDDRTSQLLDGWAIKRTGARCVRSALCTWRRGAQISWLSLKTKVDSLSVV